MSKFLRQMTALSKKPSDYARKVEPISAVPEPIDRKQVNESVGGIESVGDTESIPRMGVESHRRGDAEKALGLVSIPPTDSVPPTDTLRAVPLPSPAFAPSTASATAHSANPARRPKPKPARLAQDGHSHAEQSVYAALWDAGKPEPDGNRSVTIGLGRLSRLARLSENNCRLNIRTLIKKLALEETGAENSRACIGKTYRVFNYTAILERRRGAGMEWVIRTKGVTFVSQGGEELPAGETSAPAKSETAGGAPEERGETPAPGGQGGRQGETPGKPSGRGHRTAPAGKASGGEAAKEQRKSPGASAGQAPGEGRGLPRAANPEPWPRQGKAGHPAAAEPPTVSAPPTDSIPGTDSIPPTGSAGGGAIESVGGPPTDSVPPYRNSFRNPVRNTSSSPGVALLAGELSKMGIPIDDDAARRILARCQNADSRATPQEVAHFATLKVRQLAKRRNVENWPGLLMAAVPAYFDAPASELARYRLAEMERRDHANQLARQVLEDPHATPQERAWADAILNPTAG